MTDLQIALLVQTTSGTNLMWFIVCKRWIIIVWNCILYNCCWISIAMSKCELGKENVVLGTVQVLSLPICNKHAQGKQARLPTEAVCVHASDFIVLNDLALWITFFDERFFWNNCTPKEMSCLPSIDDQVCLLKRGQIYKVLP